MVSNNGLLQLSPLQTNKKYTLWTIYIEVMTYLVCPLIKELLPFECGTSNIGKKSLPLILTTLSVVIEICSSTTWSAFSWWSWWDSLRGILTLQIFWGSSLGAEETPFLCHLHRYIDNKVVVWAHSSSNFLVLFIWLNTRTADHEELPLEIREGDMSLGEIK